MELANMGRQAVTGTVAFGRRSLNRWRTLAAGGAVMLASAAAVQGDGRADGPIWARS